MSEAPEYAVLRVKDLKLARRLKSRTALEGREIWETLEQAIKEYLKKPLTKQ